jgi:hypothetical protein
MPSPKERVAAHVGEDFQSERGSLRGDNGASCGLARIRGGRATLLTANAPHLRDYGFFGCRTDRGLLFADAPHFGDAASGLPIFISILTRRLLHLKHTSRQPCSVHGAFKNEVWPFVAA